MERLGSRLAQASERPDLPWTFRVVDDPTPNAFAAPGGYFFITRGLQVLFLEYSRDDENSNCELSVPAGLEEDAEVAGIKAVLDAMDPPDREILSLSLYQGYSHGDIARRLSIPLGTVKTRLRRGLIRIRQQLETGATACVGVQT
ncbi:MAG: M48 family metalloprotease [Chromatiales bacterium]|nr:M48 family metalloprotease [Chromatiales bacterium]